MVYIEVPFMNDSISLVELDNTAYYIRFTYNETLDLWHFSILDLNEKELVGMIPIVPNFPLTNYVSVEGLPTGHFGAVSELQRIGYEDFKNGNAEFVYISESEDE